MITCTHSELPELEGKCIRCWRDEAREAREAAALDAEGAQLPDGYQWGPDAIEAFRFGKACAAKAIRGHAKKAAAPCATCGGSGLIEREVPGLTSYRGECPACARGTP